MNEPGISYAENYGELRRLASLVPADQAVVEIGTFRGASAEVLGHGAKEGGGAHVWTVDPHDLPGYRTTTGFSRRKIRRRLNFTDPEHRIAATRRLQDAGLLGSRVTVINAFSTDAAEQWSGPKVGMLYLDGDHRQGAVRLDFSAWERHLASHAIVAFDDYDPRTFPGVVATVWKLVDKSILTPPTFVGGMAVTRKVR